SCWPSDPCWYGAGASEHSGFLPHSTHTGLPSARVIWRIEFFEDDNGRQPAREWLQSLDSSKRAAAIAAIETHLAEFGLDICSTEHGKHLGQGLFEFRVRHDEGVIRRKAGQVGNANGSEVLLRIFCHAHGEKIVLLL